MRAFWAIAVNGFREARRNRVTLVVALFTLGLVLSASLLINAAVATVRRTLVDFGLGSMSLLLVLLATFLSSGLLGREIERRTVFLMASRPISRATLLTGRLAGNLLTLGVLLLLMAGIFFGELLFFGFGITAAHGMAIGALFVDLVIVSSIGVLMSSFAGQLVSMFVTVGFYFAGNLASDIYKLAAKAASPVAGAIGKGVYYILPNFERLNFRPYAAYDITPAIGDFLASMTYGVAYSAIVVSVAVVIFDRRDFK